MRILLSVLWLAQLTKLKGQNLMCKTYLRLNVLMCQCKHIFSYIDINIHSYLYTLYHWCEYFKYITTLDTLVWLIIWLRRLLYACSNTTIYHYHQLIQILSIIHSKLDRFQLMGFQFYFICNMTRMCMSRHYENV